MDYNEMNKTIGSMKKYLSQPNLASRWALLTDDQKKNAAALKKEFGWTISIAIQQAYFFNNTPEKERRWNNH